MTQVSHRRGLKMPKETFNNLPSEKKESILDAAQTEFLERGFDLSSIQRIIKAGGISRGSFYQYFEDKQDLFALVVSRGRDKKIRFLKPILDKQKNLNFFDFIKQLYLAGLEFGRNNPELTKIGIDMINAKTLDSQKLIKDLRSETYQNLEIEEEDFYKKCIQNSIDSGEIVSDYSAEAISFYVSTLLNGLGGYIAEHYTSDKSLLTEAENFFDEIIEIFKTGIIKGEKR